MSWKRILREAGYDPEVVKDAIEALEVGKIETRDLKGAVIGDPRGCCGSKLICRSLQAEMAWVGAEVAIVVFSKKRIRRYKHNGGIPSMQDQGFSRSASRCGSTRPTNIPSSATVGTASRAGTASSPTSTASPRSSANSGDSQP